ncbi:MarR family winged helix-turn-helix transcriptional regulator [Yoonia sp.]|uniref:MarR family winged helix-turn-helix transcriptional regulator n=1 Tax=Yoonia sp. TaxID=2212373 RepID=UPI002FD92BF0
MDEQDMAMFAVFNEIGIINQLGSTLFQARLPDGLQVPHFAVLNHLVRLGDGRTPLSIASAFQVPKTTMTHTLAGLEKRGLITMEPNPTDGRSKVVRLTETGRAARAAAIATMAAPIARIRADLGDEVIFALLPQLQTLRQFLDQNRDP